MEKAIKAVDIRVYSGASLGVIYIETVDITPEIMTLLSELDEFKGAWQELLCSLYYFASLDGLTVSFWRSHVKFVP